MHTIPPLATRNPTYKAQYLHDPTSYVDSSVPYSEHTDLSTSTCGPHELHGCGPTLLGYSMQPNPLILRGSFFGSYLHQNTGKKCFHLPEKRNFSLEKSVPLRVENKKEKNKMQCGEHARWKNHTTAGEDRSHSQKRSLHNRRFVRVCDTRSDSTYLTCGVYVVFLGTCWQSYRRSGTRTR